VLDERSFGTGAERQSLWPDREVPLENLSTGAPSLCLPAQGHQHLGNWRLLGYEVIDVSRILVGPCSA
jgi:hypothetical protein